MDYVLLILVTVFCSTRAIIMKKMGHDSSNMSGVLFLNSNIFFIGSLTVILLSAGDLGALFCVSGASVLFALVFAVFLLVMQVTLMLALGMGAASLSTLIYSCGFVIPIFYSAIFLSEEISLWQWLGLLLLSVALIFIIPPKKGEKLSVKWLVFAVCSMVGSGSLAIVQKIHQNSPYKPELQGFIFYGLLFASVLLLLASLVTKKGERRELLKLYSSKKTTVLLVAVGIIVGALNVINTSLTGKLPSIIHFPVYNGCSLILTALAGRFLFGERIGKLKLSGFILGLIAIIIIGLL
ncbi:MAG: EamA family transporter [Clostridia bacterium]|nr:EamA family transporter [Clostridia bacterium]